MAKGQKNFKATLNNTQIVARREQTVQPTEATPKRLQCARGAQGAVRAQAPKSGHCMFRGGKSIGVEEYAKNRGCSLQALMCTHCSRRAAGVKGDSEDVAVLRSPLPTAASGTEARLG